MTTNLQNWKRIRASIRAQFTRWESNLKTHENLDYAETHVRLQSLHEDFQRIRELQQNIISEVPDEELDNEIETSYNIEEEFISIKVQLLNMQQRAESNSTTTRILQLDIENRCTRCDTLEKYLNKENLQSTTFFEDSANAVEKTENTIHDSLESIFTDESKQNKEQDQLPSKEEMNIQYEYNSIDKIYDTLKDERDTNDTQKGKYNTEQNENRMQSIIIIIIQRKLKNTINRFKSYTKANFMYLKVEHNELKTHIKHKWKEKEECE